MRRLALPFVLALSMAAGIFGASSSALATAAVDSGVQIPGVGPRNLVRQQSTILSATLASSRSFSLTRGTDIGAYGLLVLHICVTDSDNSVTALAMSCTESLDDNNTDYILQDTTGGTSVDAGWNKDPHLMTNKCWPWRVDIEGFEDVECTFTNTGGTGADALVVKGTLAIKG